MDKAKKKNHLKTDIWSSDPEYKTSRRFSDKKSIFEVKSSTEKENSVTLANKYDPEEELIPWNRGEMRKLCC